MATNAELDRRVTVLETNLNKHLIEYAQSSTKVAAALGLNEGQTPINKRLENIEKAPTRAIIWLGGIVIGAAVTVMASNYLLHSQTEAAAQQASVSAKAAATQATAANQKLSTLAPN